MSNLTFLSLKLFLLHWSFEVFPIQRLGKYSPTFSSGVLWFVFLHSIFFKSGEVWDEPDFPTPPNAGPTSQHLYWLSSCSYCYISPLEWMIMFSLLKLCDRFIIIISNLILTREEWIYLKYLVFSPIKIMISQFIILFFYISHKFLNFSY